MVNDALWREVSDTEKGEIKQEIKHLLGEFASKLESLKLPKMPKKSSGVLREEGTGWITDAEFRDHMFANAPLVQDDFIVAERGKWKKK